MASTYRHHLGGARSIVPTCSPIERCAATILDKFCGSIYVGAHCEFLSAYVQTKEPCTIGNSYDTAGDRSADSRCSSRDSKNGSL